MAARLKLFCYSFKNASLRSTHFSRTIFSIKKTHLVPRTPEGFNLEEFNVFYHIPAIRLISALSRLKYLKAAIAAGTSSLGYMAYKNKIMSREAFIVLSLTAAYCTLGLFATASLCKNLIGKMYTNKEQTEVVLAYINSRGQRINKRFKSSELQISDHPNNLARKYFKQVTCPEKDLKYNLYFGESANMNFMIFCKVFPNFE